MTFASTLGELIFSPILLPDEDRRGTIGSRIRWEYLGRGAGFDGWWIVVQYRVRRHRLSPFRVFGSYRWKDVIVEDAVPLAHTYKTWNPEEIATALVKGRRRRHVITFEIEGPFYIGGE